MASLPPFSLPVRSPHIVWVVVLGCGYLLVSGIFLRQYLLWNPQWLLGLALLPFISLPTTRRDSWVLLLLTLVLLAVAGYAQITTVYFLGCLLACWFGAQQLLGWSGGYPLLMLLVSSPIFKYVADIWSFPLRMQLSQAAAFILSWGNHSVEAAGNIILLNGEEFSVDPACTGLHMLSFSYMIGIFLLAHLHRSRQKPWPFWMIASLMGMILGLNLISNLLRILVLVLFKIGPESPAHDAVGLLCLAGYALLPFYFLVNTLSRSIKPADPTPANLASANFPPKALLLHLGLLLCLAGTGFLIQQPRETFTAAASLQLPGYKEEVLPNGVRKFTSGNALIYLKPMRAFYSTEHHPLICWEGSGYLFTKVLPQEIAGQQVLTGTLLKGEDKLYTAWWMDNGQHQSIAQTDWRWRMLQGEATFQLVNVTAASPAALLQEVRQLLASNRPALTQVNHP